MTPRGALLAGSVALCVLLAALIPGTASSRRAVAPPISQRLLERYRPELRYSSKEKYFAQPVSLPPESAEVRPGDRVYGHIATETGKSWLQYWLFYADNPQDRGLLHTGRHEGDWEMVQIGIGPDGFPETAVMSQHSWAERCDWNEIEHAGKGPVVYVANGSHANYSAAGKHGRPFPDPTDEAGGDGRRARPAVIEIDDERPGWVAYDGRWGRTEAGIVPGETSSPLGPRFQESGAWQKPSTYAADLARSCGSDAPGRPWVTAASAAFAALVVGAVLVLIRRRRS